MQERVPRDDEAVGRLLRSVVHNAMHEGRGQIRSADLVYERVFKVEVNRMESGQIVLKPGSLNGALQLRLVDHDGRALGVKSTSLDESELSELVRQAREMLQHEAPDPKYGLSPIPNRERTRYGIASESDPREDHAGAWLHTLANAVNDVTQANTPKNVSVTSELWAWWQVEEKWVVDSEGLFKTQTMPIVFMQVTLRAKRGDTMRSVRLRIGEPGGLEAFISPQGELTNRVRVALEQEQQHVLGLLDARALRRDELNKVTHYVLHNSALVFIHEGLGHPIEADIVRSGSSAIVASDGSPIANPLGSSVVRIVDGPGLGPNTTWTTGFGTECIDDEGVEVQETVLVEHGKIVGMMHSRETAHHYGVTPTGNGFSQMGDRRIVRMRNTLLRPEPGPHWVASLQELVKDIEFGVLLHGSLGGAVGREGMASSTQFGYLIREGRVTNEMVLPGNFAARTLDCLRTVEGFAGDVATEGVGFCGKSGQTRRVSEGGPEYTRLRVSAAVQFTFAEAAT